MMVRAAPLAPHLAAIPRIRLTNWGGCRKMGKKDRNEAYSAGIGRRKNRGGQDMTLNLENPRKEDMRPRIAVFGVGGAGGNAVDNMIARGLEGVDFVVANTDMQALGHSRSPTKVQIGVKATEGLGAGASAEVGAEAARENMQEIVDHLSGAHMCFITAGMGGGTGTGAAPVVAAAARKLGVLTVGVVTKPFQFEGSKRMHQAEDGVEMLQKEVDTLIVIPNQNLFRLANEQTTVAEAFALADDVLYYGVKGVTDLMVRPGLINLDFADVRSVMDEMGKAMMGAGEADGDDRAIRSAEKAIANPLLDEISLETAKGVLINIIGGPDLTLFEVDEAANRIRNEVDADANIIIGSTLDESMEGSMRVSIVATGIDVSGSMNGIPSIRRPVAEPLQLGNPLGPAERGEDGEGISLRDPDGEMPRPRLVESWTEGDRETGLESPEGGAFRNSGPREGTEQTEGADASGEEYPDAPNDPGQAPFADEPAFRSRADSDGWDGRSSSGLIARRPDYPDEEEENSGGPSAEAILRLQSAAQHAAPANPPEHEAEQESGGTRERRRFGIEGLIGRITGSNAGSHGDALPPETRPAEQSSSGEDSEIDPDIERIEIPAFLRRQAN